MNVLKGVTKSYPHVCILINMQKSVKLGWCPPYWYILNEKKIECTEGTDDKKLYESLTRERNSLEKPQQQTVWFMNLIPNIHFLGKSETLTLSLISQIRIPFIHLCKHAIFQTFTSNKGCACVYTSISGFDLRV